MAEILRNIPVVFDTESLLKRVHVKSNTEDATELERLVATARNVAAPKVLYAETFIEARGEDTVCINGITFTSRMLATNLANVERVFPYVATCGHEMDDVPLAKGDFLQEYWWDAIKAVVLGSAIHFFRDQLRQKYLLEKTSDMKPGSGDADVWPIQQQQDLFALLGDVQGLIGVALTPSFLMKPNKSVSGIVFPTEKNYQGCQVCRREDCTSRNAPFDKELWDSIQHS